MRAARRGLGLAQAQARRQRPASALGRSHMLASCQTVAFQAPHGQSREASTLGSVFSGIGKTLRRTPGLGSLLGNGGEDEGKDEGKDKTEGEGEGDQVDAAEEAKKNAQVARQVTKALVDTPVWSTKLLLRVIVHGGEEVPGEGADAGDKAPAGDKEAEEAKKKEETEKKNFTEMVVTILKEMTTEELGHRSGQPRDDEMYDRIAQSTSIGVEHVRSVVDYHDYFRKVHHDIQQRLRNGLRAPETLEDFMVLRAMNQEGQAPPPRWQLEGYKRIIMGPSGKLRKRQWKGRKTAIWYPRNK